MLGNLIVLAILALIVGAITAIGVFVVGMRLLPGRKIGAVLVSASAAPLLIFALTGVQICTAPNGPPPNDVRGMITVGLLLFGLLAAPIALLSSAAIVALVLKSRSRGGAHS